MAKIEEKMLVFRMEEHELKNCEKSFQNIVFFNIDTSVFVWFALRTGSKK